MKDDENGYLRGNPEHSDLISRQIAFKKIYELNRDKYPLPFSKYVIHHRDRDKHNNSVKNLDIVTPQDHTEIHKSKLKGKVELDKRRREIENKSLLEQEESNTWREIEKKATENRSLLEQEESNTWREVGKSYKNKKYKYIYEGSAGKLNPFYLIGSWIGLFWGFLYILNIYEGDINLFILYPFIFANTFIFKIPVHYNLKLAIIVLIYSFLLGYIIHLLIRKIYYKLTPFKFYY